MKVGATTGRSSRRSLRPANLMRCNPHAWLTDALTKLVNRWPACRIDELMPWAYAKTAPSAVNV